LLSAADPIERIISAPKDSLVNRAASPRRPQTPKRSTTEIVLDPLPRLSGIMEVFLLAIFLIFGHLLLVLFRSFLVDSTSF
jgi:hypothetical protein